MTMPVNETPDLPTMKTSSLDEQAARQRISPQWQPNGFERYRQQKALLDQMAVLGGVHENGGVSPERVLPVGSLEEDFPIKK